MMGERITPPRTEGELARLLERGRELGRRAVPEILRKCAHEPQKLRVTGRGAHSILIMCACGSGTMALLVPARPFSKAEVDAIIGLARESEW